MYRLIIREMDLRMPVDDPSKFVSKMASKLGVSVETEFKTIDIIRSARMLNGLSGKNPVGVAAAALYKACRENNERRAQKEVAFAAGTTEITIRNRLKDLDILFS